MKAFKKMVSFAVAGSMALAMLTACSGSSGSCLSYENSRIGAAAKLLAGGKAQVTYTEGEEGEKRTVTEAINGNIIYDKIDEENGDSYTLLTVNEEEVYLLDGGAYYLSSEGCSISVDNGKAIKLGTGLCEKVIDHEDPGYLISVSAPTEDKVMKITAGTAQYGGKTYYTETAQLDGENSQVIELTYYFEGNSTIPQYVSDEYFIDTILEYTSDVDESLLTVPTDYITEEEYIAAQ